MKAIILAGGRGKRLRPITDYVPKPLIPINNIPIIEWQIRYLKKFGISEAIICSGYKTEMIENYLENKKLGIKISFSIENKPLGTGGAIKKAAKKMEDVVNDKETHELKKKWENFDIDDKYWIIIESNNFSRRKG